MIILNSETLSTNSWVFLFPVKYLHIKSYIFTHSNFEIVNLLSTAFVQINHTFLYLMEEGLFLEALQEGYSNTYIHLCWF